MKILWIKMLNAETAKRQRRREISLNSQYNLPTSFDESNNQKSKNKQPIPKYV